MTADQIRSSGVQALQERYEALNVARYQVRSTARTNPEAAISFANANAERALIKAELRSRGAALMLGVKPRRADGKMQHIGPDPSVIIEQMRKDPTLLEKVLKALKGDK